MVDVNKNNTNVKNETGPLVDKAGFCNFHVRTFVNKLW